MKFIINRTSTPKFEEIKEINTLDDLVSLLNVYGCDLVLGENDLYESEHDAPYVLTVYDDYLE